MKKVFVFAAAAICAAALAVSCDKNSIETVDNPQVGSRVLTCVFAEPDSKFSIDNEGKTAWEVGDEIFVHAGEDGTESITYALTASDISNNGKTATVHIGELAPYVRTDVSYESTYYAIYPASAVTNTNPMYYNTRINDFSMPVMGGYDDANGNLVFHNLCGVITFTVTGDFDSFSFSGNEQEAVTYTPEFQWRITQKTDHTEYFDVKLTSDGAQCNPETEITKPVLTNGELNYVCVPNGVKLNGGFTLKFYKGDEIKKVAVTEKSVNLARNKMLILGDITGKLTDYVAPNTDASTHTSGINNATDLSSAGPANCYIITAPGAYKLPVVKGNSNESAGYVYDAAILWETYNNNTEVVVNSVIASIDFDGPQNYVYFTTPAELKPGNAVIAAKDYQGKIIWSWHIWIPSTAISNVAASDICGFTIMDRNLGALEATSTEGATVESYGLFYEWGRKDPFPGAKKVAQWTTLAKIAPEDAITISSEISSASAVANPTVYAKDFAPASGSWAVDSKTINDPCPAGYRMPYAAKNSYPLYNTSNIGTACGDGKWEANAEGSFLRLGSGANAVIFPAAGYLDNTIQEVSHGSDRAAIWYIPTDTSSYYHINLRIDEGSYKAGSTSAKRGCNVRCVVM